MGKYAIIKINGEKEELINALTRSKSKLYQNFTYNEARANDYAKHLPTKIEHVATFVSHNTNNPIAFVWVVITENELYISNITPKITGRLSPEEYKAIMDNFNDEVLKESNIT